MKVVIFTENIHCGGLDSFLISLVNHWPHVEDELRLVCNPSHPGYPILKERITQPCIVECHDISTYPALVISTNRSRWLRTMRRAVSPFLRYGYFAYYLLKVGLLIRQWGADRLMVVNGGHPGGDTCRAATIAWKLFARNKPPAIYNVHNLASPPNRIDKFPEKLLDLWLVHSAASIIAVSKVCAESLRKRIGDRGMQKVVSIYNGIPAPENGPSGSSLRADLRISDAARLCLMLATYEPRKGHDFLFRAFRQVIQHVPDAYLVVCGYGYPEEVERVRELVKTYGLTERVRLEGFRRDVDAMLKQADVLLVASQSYESFGLTSVEAMANRIPVVATRVGGIPEVVVDGEGGFCVEPDNADGYAACIVRLLEDPAFRQSQGERGYQRYKQLFMADRMAEQYALAIRRVTRPADKESIE